MRWVVLHRKRAIGTFSFLKGKCTPYLEVLNILDDEEQNTEFHPYYMTNYYLMSISDNYQYEYGRRMRAGLMISF